MAPVRAAYHDWKLTSQIMKRELEETGLFAVTVVSVAAGGWRFLQCPSRFRQIPGGGAELRFPGLAGAAESEFEAYMKNGGGLVVVHGADNAFPDWAAFNEMTGVGGWRKRDAPAGPKWYFQNGKLTSDMRAGPAGMHGKRKPFRITCARPSIPSCAACRRMDARRRRALYPPARPGKT
jgi:hypothetical protein